MSSRVMVTVSDETSAELAKEKVSLGVKDSRGSVLVGDSTSEPATLL